MTKENEAKKRKELKKVIKLQNSELNESERDISEFKR